ncbi:HAD-IC family P-type ATPase [Actinoplanes bogorensis]|uniref:HAD-IC family P-type ATPase n=1 Tax=Paractinoplanes bogorensis TaxID=1610840 RepID=A0ABS5YJH4_9ACTN|nr:HAD-IC family P-type ATPase [Actinoplanes bogorensis]
MAAISGLTSAEAAERRRRGEANVAAGKTRSVAAILRANVFSFFNLILFVIGAALLALGRYSDALISVGLGLINAVLSAAQEIRAKRKLDRLQLLDRAGVRVLRDGAEVSLAPGEVVRGDLLRIRAGDQIVVDGPLLPGDSSLHSGGRVDVDESLLTGESDPIAKGPGDDLRSGSFCVAGDGFQLARDVGAHSYAGRLTAEARQVSTDKTPLQRRVEFVVRLVIALTVLMSGAIVAQALLEGFSLLRVVQITAVLSGLVPYGLFLLIAVAYTTGAAALAGQGALVQQVNAVESISNVDVICTDKTGTLTTGRLTLDEIVPLGSLTADEAGTVLGSYARSVTTPNLTTTALAAALPGEAWTDVTGEVPFTSATRRSSLTTPDGTWELGAADSLGPEVAVRAARGLRVLALSRSGEPVALVALADELRPDVAASVTRFHADGVTLKVLSGDDPRTVAALAARAGLGTAEPVSGAEIDELDDALIARTTVFGRVSPEQKERIVAALRRRGHYVAMIGDGVNDARALKAAQVGVAMRSGSAVTRDVADIVLTDDSFAALLPAQQQGRRIISGIGVSMHVFLARVATQGIVILAVSMLGMGFPYSPTQVGLTLLTVGVPTFFLTFWARPVPPDKHLLGNLARFVIPAAVVTAGFGTAIYAYLYQLITTGFTSGRIPADSYAAFEKYTGLSSTDSGFTAAAAAVGAQTGLSTFYCLASFILILFLAPPARFFAAWTTPTGDRRPTILVAALILVFTAVLFVPALSDYFGLTGPAEPVFDVVLPALALWFGALSAAFRFKLLDRALGI